MGRLDKRRAHWFHDRVMSPYNLREGIRVTLANWFPDQGLRRRMDLSARQEVLAPDLAPALRIGLVGDIMDMRGKALEWDDEVAAFFADCDVMVGNFEAVMAPRRTHLLQQRHTPDILRSLRQVAACEKWYLSVANNHAGDYGPAAFQASCARLEQEGFHVFGLKDRPYVDVGAHLRVTTGSMWTNMPCDGISDLDDIADHGDPERYQLLYPHWGYELESEPRPDIVALGEALIRQADAVVGHHSHVPQSIQLLPGDGRTKIMAPSLGDFCTGTAGEGYDYGTMLKLTLGRPSAGPCQLSEVEWKPLQMVREKQTVRVAPLPTLAGASPVRTLEPVLCDPAWVEPVSPVVD